MGKTLKERFSAALIKGTTVATLLTAGGYAAAQTGSTQEKQEHKLEYSQNPHRSMEVPVFFKTSIWRCLRLISQKQWTRRKLTKPNAFTC